MYQLVDFTSITTSSQFHLIYFVFNVYIFIIAQCNFLSSCFECFAVHK